MIGPASAARAATTPREIFCGGESDQQRLVAANMLEQSAKTFRAGERANIAGICAGERQKTPHALVILGQKNQ